MQTPEYETSPSEVRTFALLQLGLMVVFLTLLFLAFGGIDGDLPPWWIIAGLLAAVAIAGFLSERVWMTAKPMRPGSDPNQMKARAVGIFAGQVVRKLAYCTAAIIVAVAVGFVGPYAGWPILIGGAPGLIVLTFETWPSLRNTSIAEAMLDAEGAESGLVEAFRKW